jgi:hypothetical protein
MKVWDEKSRLLYNYYSSMMYDLFIDGAHIIKRQDAWVHRNPNVSVKHIDSSSVYILHLYVYGNEDIAANLIRFEKRNFFLMKKVFTINITDFQSWKTAAFTKEQLVILPEGPYKISEDLRKLLASLYMFTGNKVDVWSLAVEEEKDVYFEFRGDIDEKTVCTENWRIKHRRS